jgi:4-hydroxybenzoate polyprenyltransferase
LVVAVAWSLIPIYVAAFIGFEPHLLMSSFIVSIFIFLRIFIGVVMFDIRDVAGDIAAGIQTIPVRLGVEKSLVIVRFGNIGSFILFISAAICGMLNSVVAISAAVIAFCMGFAYEWAVKQDKIDFRLFCDVVVDSEYVLLGLPALFHSLVKI